ncbi:MAG: hypothetical protein ACD_8C00087G0009 [uncultured bacterium]|nr:MAG: hypothetical protein ACD_8C00087G0009 [uncultured bacterium]
MKNKKTEKNKKKEVGFFESIIIFFDKFEDGIRGWLSRRPILYAFIGGSGVIIFWRGIWHWMDFAVEYFSNGYVLDTSVSLGGLIWWDGPLSIVIGLLILLLTGIFTSSFIGNEIIISGIRGEKKTVDKTEVEIRAEAESLRDIKKDLRKIIKTMNKK